MIMRINWFTHNIAEAGDAAQAPLTHTQKMPSCAEEMPEMAEDPHHLGQSIAHMSHVTCRGVLQTGQACVHAHSGGCNLQHAFGRGTPKGYCVAYCPPPNSTEKKQEMFFFSNYYTVITK